MYTTVGKKLFQEIHVYFEVVDIETDLDWFGFDEFEDIKTERFLKYDEMVIMSNLIDEDIYQTGAKFCDTTFKLAEDVRTQRRVYTKFVTILGDVGGLMEVLFTLFRIISSFSVDILYEVSMVGGLFEFDLDKNNVIIKEKRLGKMNPLSNQRRKEKEKEKIDEKYEGIEKSAKNSAEEKENNLEERITVVRKTLNHRTNKVTTYKRGDSRKDLSNYNFTSSKTKAFYQEIELGNKSPRKGTRSSSKQMSKENRTIVKKVRLSRACVYLWFCFVRRGKNTDNILINEGMDIISKKLDIFNIFEKIYKDDQKNEPMLNKIFPMSDECKTGLKLLRHDTENSISSKASSGSL